MRQNIFRPGIAHAPYVTLVLATLMRCCDTKIAPDGAGSSNADLRGSAPAGITATFRTSYEYSFRSEIFIVMALKMLAIAVSPVSPQAIDCSLS